MSLPVSLKAVAEELELVGDDSFAYLHRTTGELITLTREELAAAEEIEEDDPLEDFPEWERESIRKAAEVFSSPEFLQLPTKYDIHEYAIMEKFCFSVEDDELSEELLYQIRGSGAFRRFRDALHRYDLTDAWYEYRRTAFEEIAAAWLEENDIPYVRP